MLKPSAKTWRKFSDFLVTWVGPVTTFIAFLFGWLRGLDLAQLSQAYPGWAGLLEPMERWGATTTFLICGTLSFFITLISTSRNKGLQELTGELEQSRSQLSEIGSNIKNLFDGTLLGISKRLGFSQSSQARISLYIHDAENSRFIPCGRYSPNPELRKPGRTSYPDNEGCIAAGWKNGWHFDGGVPRTPVKRRTYIRNAYDIPDHTQLEMKMQARLYAVLRLDCNVRGPLAVIVVEALGSNDFDEQTLRDRLIDTADDLVSMIGTLRTHIPTPADAADRGL